MSINISYSKIYHQARILDTPEEEGVTNMPDRKGWKDDTLKKNVFGNGWATKAVEHSFFCKRWIHMTLEHVGKSQTHVTCGVDTLKPFTQFSFCLMYFDNLYFLLGYPICRL